MANLPPVRISQKTERKHNAEMARGPSSPERAPPPRHNDGLGLRDFRGTQRPRKMPRSASSPRLHAGTSHGACSAASSISSSSSISTATDLTRLKTREERKQRIAANVDTETGARDSHEAATACSTTLIPGEDECGQPLPGRQ